MNGLVNLDDLGEVLERVVVNGDLSPLTAAQRTVYYRRMCESLGLNPLTKPFAYIKMPNGKMILYALRDAADQLRQKHSISIEIVSRVVEKGILSVHVRAKTKDGRTDEDVGAVPYPATVSGEAASNLMMKAITKAKRRVTLSISGLGMLDETEVGSVPGAQLVGSDGKPIIPGADAAPIMPDKRKSSAAAKRDGTNDVFQKIKKEIFAAKATEELEEIRDRYAQEIADLPERWHQLIIDDYEVRSEELFLIEDHPGGRAQ